MFCPWSAKSNGLTVNILLTENISSFMFFHIACLLALEFVSDNCSSEIDSCDWKLLDFVPDVHAAASMTFIWWGHTNVASFFFWGGGGVIYRVPDCTLMLKLIPYYLLSSLYFMSSVVKESMWRSVVAQKNISECMLMAQLMLFKLWLVFLNDENVQTIMDQCEDISSSLPLFIVLVLLYAKNPHLEMLLCRFVKLCVC